MKRFSTALIATILLASTALALPARLPDGNNAIFIHGWGRNFTTSYVPAFIPMQPPPVIFPVPSRTGQGIPRKTLGAEQPDDVTDTTTTMASDETKQQVKRQYPRIIDPHGYDFEMPAPVDWETGPEVCDNFCKDRWGDGLEKIGQHDAEFGYSDFDDKNARNGKPE